jgi:vacuolar-type H+-ATPase catalytic subunit A/Vma1
MGNKQAVLGWGKKAKQLTSGVLDIIGKVSPDAKTFTDPLISSMDVIETTVDALTDEKKPLDLNKFTNSLTDSTKGYKNLYNKYQSTKEKKKAASLSTKLKIADDYNDIL